MEKSRNFQIVYVGRTNLSKQTNWPRERYYETGDSPAATLSHWGQASSCKPSECGSHGLSNILKLQATFLYSIYHQRAGKTNLFHTRGGRVHAGNTLCTFNFFHFFHLYSTHLINLIQACIPLASFTFVVKVERLVHAIPGIGVTVVVLTFLWVFWNSTSCTKQNVTTLLWTAIIYYNKACNYKCSQCQGILVKPLHFIWNRTQNPLLLISN